MNNNTLFQKEYYWKFLAIEVNNKIYGVSNMHFYNKDGIICTLNRVMKPKFEGFSFEGNTVRKLKLPNFEKFTDNFIIKNHDDFYDLYINVENVDLIYNGYKREDTALFKHYEVNDIKFEIYYKKIENKIYEYEDQIKEDLSDIRSYIERCNTKDFDYKQCLKNISETIKKLDGERLRVNSLYNEFTF